jgi:hypothetical protein
VAHPFQAIVFDNDGLLVDTEEVWTRAESAREFVERVPSVAAGPEVTGALGL